MTKIVGGLVIVSAMALILASSFSSADSNNKTITNAFQNKNELLESIEKNETLVELALDNKNISITKKDYFQYRENLKLVHQVNTIPFNEDPTDIVNQMINSELLNHFSRNQNVKVTDEEVMEYALQTKTMLLPGNSTPELLLILEKLAEELNVNVDEYFTHPTVLEKYKEIVTLNKVIDKLYSEGVLDDNVNTLQSLQTDLKKQYSKNIKIKKEAINNIKEMK